MSLPNPPGAAPGTTPGPKKRSSGVIVGTIVMVVSVIVGIISIVMVATPTLGVIGGPTMLVPGTQSFDLEPGTYAVYERTGAANSFATGGLTTIRSSDVTVTSPSGTSMSVSPVRYSQNINDQDYNYTAVAQFGATTKGSYKVEVDSGTAGVVKIGPTIDSLGGQIVGWVLAMLASGALFVVGLIVLIVALVRRSRASRAQSSGPPFAGPGYGPGWQPPGAGYGPPGPGYGPPGAPPGPRGYAGPASYERPPPQQSAPAPPADPRRAGPGRAEPPQPKSPWD